MVAGAPLLAMRGIAKRYPNGTVALVDASLSMAQGEVHGLLGANGAGKSTLVSILSAATAPGTGEVLWRGAPVHWRRPLDARRAGVATIYQHLPLVPTLSALENILLDRTGGWRRDPRERRRVAALVGSLGAPFALDELVSSLPIGARQMVSIAQALATGADLIVMDEPTASLAGAERDSVHRVVRSLAREQGKSVLLVSHFLDEVLALTDRVTVLRDGRDVLSCETARLDAPALAAAISGRPLVRLAREAGPAPAGAPVLEVRGLRSPGRLAGIDLALRAGEVLGVAGMLGSGRSELLRAIFGADPQARGEVLLDGRRVAPGIAAAVAAGIALVPEDRRRCGYVPDFSIAENLALPARPAPLLLDREREAAAAREAIRRLSIKAAGEWTPLEALSGGNAQKVVIGKWLSPLTRVLLLDEPTAGIDVAARADVLALVRGLAGQGLAVLLVSSDLAELVSASDRIVVLRDGAMVATVDPARSSEQELILLAGHRAGTAAGASR